MMLPSVAGFGDWSIVVVAVVLGIFVSKALVSKVKSGNLPPGPRALPIIGNLHLLGKHPHVDIARLAETYGPVMSLWFGQKLTVVATSPAAAEQILKTQGLNFTSRPTTTFKELVVPESVVFPNETPKRRHMKKILHTHLSTSKFLQQSESVRAEEITHMLRMITLDGTTAVPVRGYLEVVVTNILSRMILKKRLMAVAGKGDSEGLEFETIRKFKAIVDEIGASSLHIHPGDFIPILNWVDFSGFTTQIRNLKKKMDAFMATIVAEHRQVRKKFGLVSHDKDLVDVFLDQMEDESLRFEINEQSIYSALWDAFIGGTLTTTDTGEWAMSECIRNPQVMRKVQAEIDAVVGTSRRVEEADIPNLKYLQAVIKETFRLHISPPMLIPRENETECKILGYDIPKGTTVIVNAGAIARDPGLWDDPLKFKPERFLDGSPCAYRDVQGNHFELLPFGSGRRQCAGIGLGLAMTHILTATLLQLYDWSLPNGLQPTDLDMSEAEGMLPHRAHSLSAIPKPRLSISSIDKKKKKKNEDPRETHVNKASISL